MFPRRTQVVSSKAQRNRGLGWVNEQDAENGTASGLCIATMEALTNIFRVYDAKSRSNCIKKASCWLKERDCFISAIQDPRNRQMIVTSVGRSGVSVKRTSVKSLAGRVRKRATWVEYVHTILLMDFERYVAAGV